MAGVGTKREQIVNKFRSIEKNVNKSDLIEQIVNKPSLMEQTVNKPCIHSPLAHALTAWNKAGTPHDHVITLPYFRHNSKLDYLLSGDGARHAL